MYNISVRSVWIGAETLQELDWKVLPSEMPQIDEGLVVICGILQGADGETLMVCEDLEDVSSVFDAQNPAVKWYTGKNPVMLLIDEVESNLQDTTTGETHPIVCECMGMNCGMTVVRPFPEVWEVMYSGLVAIVDGCITGPLESDLLVRECDGYKLYREG